MKEIIEETMTQKITLFHLSLYFGLGVTFGNDQNLLLAFIQNHHAESQPQVGHMQIKSTPYLLSCCSSPSSCLLKIIQ